MPDPCYSSEAADKEHFHLRFGKRLITLEERFVCGARDRIIRIAFGLWIFAHDRGAVVPLTCQMLEFGDPGVCMIIGIIDRSDALITGDSGQMFSF